MDSRKEKKKKIRQLELDIKEMQKDHARIFGDIAPQKKEPSFRDMILLVAGIICLSAGLIWISSNFQVAMGFAALRIGRLRFTSSVYSLPLMIGILMFMLCRKPKFSLLVIAVGAAAAVFGALFGISSAAEPVPVCLTMFAVTFAGIVLLMLAAVRLLFKNQIKEE